MSSAPNATVTIDAASAAHASGAANPVAAVRWLDAAHLARGVALAAAVAASVLGAELIGSLPAAAGALLAVCLLAGSAALITLQDRLPAPRSVLAWVLWSIGGVVFLMLAIAGLLGAAAALTAQHGAVTALAATLAWLTAIGMNQIEARRAFRVAGVLQRVRQVLAGLSALWVLVLASLWLADRAGVVAGRELQRTAFEALAPGAGWLLAGLFALVVGATAWHLPRWLARSQLQGRIAASAAGEATWFAALAPLAIPLALPEGAFGLAAVSLPVWGETALRVLAVVLAHGAARVWLGGAGSLAPVPLLVLVREGQMSPRLRDWLERLPLAWRGGPVIRVMPPRYALDEGGAHLRLVSRLGDEDVLFPVASQDMRAWRAAVPPARRWRALAAQELYAEPARWAECLRTLVDAQTWVLWVDNAGASLEGGPPSPRFSLPAATWAEALPAGRAVRLVFDMPSGDTALEPGEGQTLWRSMPGWVDGLGPPFPQWLRARLQPPAPRCIVVLHAPTDAALARAIVAALDGQHDAQGHAVQAWGLSDTGQALWQMPVAGFRLLARVHLDALDRPGAPEVFGKGAVASRIGTRLVRMGARLYGVKRDQPAPAYELVVLQAALPHAPSAAPLSLSTVVFQQATQRIGLRRDALSDSPVGLDAQVVAPPAATSLDDRAAWFAQRLLRHEWIGLAAPVVPTAKGVMSNTDASLELAPEPALPTPSDAPAPATRTGAPFVFISAPAGPNGRTAAIEIARQLKALALFDGLQIFLIDTLPPGADMHAASSEAIVRCTHFVPLVCNEFWTTSKTCRQELFAAVARFEETGSPRVMPVLLGAVDPDLMDFAIPRQMGELTSTQPKLGSLGDLAFIGPMDDNGRLLPIDSPHSAGRTARLGQVVDRLARALLAEGWPVAVDKPTVEATERPVRVQNLGQRVCSLVGLDASWLAAALVDGRIALWRPEHTDAPHFLSAPGGPVWAMCLAPDVSGPGLITADDKGQVIHWTGSLPALQPRLLGQHAAPTRALCITHHEGLWAVAGSDDGTISWWPLEPGADPRHQTGLNQRIESIDAEGNRLFVALGTAGVQTLQWGQPVTLPTARRSDAVRVVRQFGDNLYTGGDDAGELGHAQRIKLRREGLDPRQLTGLPSAVTALTVLADERVVLGFSDGRIGLWNPSAGANALVYLPRHDGAVRSLVEWPDGRLCSAGDGVVIVGPVPTADVSA